MQMRSIIEFIKRNTPVFVVGTITLLIFVGITLRSTKVEMGPTKLVTVGDEISFEEEDRVIPEENLDKYIKEVEESTQSSEETWYPGKNTSMHGDVLFIEYRDGKGFVPRNAVSESGKVVMWHNTTGRRIYIKQLTERFNEFDPPVGINPGKFFAVKLDEKGIWTYQEVETEDFGSVFIE